MKKETVDKILKDTESGYDLIAEKFSQTRNRFWGGLEFIKKYAKNNGKVLDFGCGNGRLLEIFGGKNIDYIGVDVSGELINLAENKYSDKVEARSVQFIKIDHDFKNLAFAKESFDAVYSIAVFHHIPSENLRIEKAKDLYRITRKGGHIIITVWDLWNKKYFKGIWINWLNKIMGKSNLDWNDAWISFTNNEGKIFNRYHHAFAKSDLRKTFRKAGFKIEEIRRVDGNIVLVGKK